MRSPFHHKDQPSAASEADLAAADVVKDNAETKSRDAERPGWPGFGMSGVSSFVTPPRDEGDR